MILKRSRPRYKEKRKRNLHWYHFYQNSIQLTTCLTYHLSGQNRTERKRQEERERDENTKIRGKSNALGLISGPRTFDMSLYVYSPVRVCENSPRYSLISVIPTRCPYIYLPPVPSSRSRRRSGQKPSSSPLPPHTPPPPARKTLVLPIEGEERNA